MQVKKYEAPTIQEALDTIKRELGPEAIILKTRQNRSGFGLMSRGSVEVTVAVSERSLKRKEITEKTITPESRELLKKAPPQKQAEVYDRVGDKYLSKVAAQTKDKVQLTQKAAAPARRYVDIQDEEAKEKRRFLFFKEKESGSEKPAAVHVPVQAEVTEQIDRLASSRSETEALRREIMNLKKALGELKSKPSTEEIQFDSPALEAAYDQLVIDGVERRYALEIVQEVSAHLKGPSRNNSEEVLDDVARVLMDSIEVEDFMADREPGTAAPSIVALVGPTGVGKTTTLAKIASLMVLKKKFKVAIVNVDLYRVGAAEQIGTYSKILNVPFRNVSNAIEFDLALQDFSSYDLILVDTTGRSPRDTETLNEMKDFIRSIPQVRCFLVASATTRDRELHELVKRFSIFKPEGLVFSKVDEASVHGALLNVSQRAKLPLVYLTNGQRVPEDIETATKERVVTLIMNL